jgi:N6-adenosine-specific RNA methylase IME4
MPFCSGMSAPELELFGTILADCPWMFQDRKAGMVKTGKGAASHYEVLPLEQIKSFLDTELMPESGQPLRAHVAENAHLWLWIPNAFLVDGTGAAVCRAWGFEPKTIATWCKGRIELRPGVSPEFEPIQVPKIVHHIGQGTYLRNNTEHCILAVKGRAPSRIKNLPTWFLAPRGQHSRKPDTIHEWAEAMSHGPRLELFGRRGRTGWRVLGNEAPPDQ